MNARVFLVSLAFVLLLGGGAHACPDFTRAGAAQAYDGQTLYSPVVFGVQAGGGNALAECGLGQLGTGYFRAAPDYSFDLTGMDGYRLVIDVDSQCDAALLVNTATGQYLYDDDSNGALDPRIEITSPAQSNGRLDVWVGTFDGAACGASLTLETFVQEAGAAAGAGGCPVIGLTGQPVSITGSALYSRQSYGVNAGGTTDLGGCAMPGFGFVDTAPNFSFTLDGMQDYGRLALTVDSGCDTTLLVNSANGSWFFDDDSNGNLDPRIDLSGPEHLTGRVDIWVGTFNGARCAANLHLETFLN